MCKDTCHIAAHIGCHDGEAGCITQPCMQQPASPPRLCVNCEHHKLDGGHWCYAETEPKMDLVTGEVHRTAVRCDYMRYDGDSSVCHCRPEGVLYKPKAEGGTV